MKKQICAALVATAISMPAMADFVGIYAGIDYHSLVTSDNANSDFEDSSNLSGYVAFEHFIPLIPNAKIKYSDLSTEYSDSLVEEDSSSALNGILYYQLFDNGLFEFDFGLAYTGVKDVAGQSADLAQAYGAAKVHVPGVGMHAFAEVIGGSLTDDNATDAEIGLAYTFNPDSNLLNFSVRAGYRFQDMEINNYTQESKGLFAGVEAHF